jgi:predicted dinucleotide-binding enzyme
MGSRTAENPKAASWVKSNGENSSQGTFDEAAFFGEIVFNCTAGAGSLDALNQAGEKNLAGKILVDVSNPLDFSKGMPPSLFVCNTDSLGEQIQRNYPDVKVVKTLNIVNCNVMINPSSIPAEHDMYICGNDAGAKETVTGILKDWFGWKSVIDLGDITGSRGMEMNITLWIRLWSVLKTPFFNIKIVK